LVAPQPALRQERESGSMRKWDEVRRREREREGKSETKMAIGFDLIEIGGGSSDTRGRGRMTYAK